ncbi:hypothetical protein NM688_g7671 [Phlebia brevispora]|uniref:Uncharacterized protein n=1 Tax=Phlebia brevispora TaxID=194682 RepID=A0ACC1S2N9_9APHY|nr:hypothetical protein NM688_g7671 [Phlebia brevispora]
MGLPFTLIVFLSAVAFVVITSRRRRARLPPGPRGIPLLGNIFDVPKSHEWLTYAKWSRQYGSAILYLNLLGTPIVILNAAKHATELFEKRSSLYSDRGQSTMLNELVGWGFDFAFMGYGDKWREHRRVFHQHFNAQAIVKYQPWSARETRALLLRLLEQPEDFMPHLRHMAGSLILSVTYGIKPLPKNDPYIATAEEAIHALTQCGNAGAYLVDYLPALQLLPSWFPGAGFKRQAAIWRKSTLEMATAPFGAVKRALQDGTAPVSVVSSLLSDLEGDSERVAHREAVIRDMAGAAYAGGADTSVSALGTFILAMLLHPNVQRKAQAELDRVVGQDRLPGYEDEANLPYITSILREVLRWRPVTPLAVPHRLSKDDEYLGYHLSAGTLVIGNEWAILHDEARYPDPHTFNPDRYLTEDDKLDPTIPNPEEFAFGFGRRICPGRFLSISSVWLTIASILTVFDLEMPIDQTDRRIKPSCVYTSGLVSYPEPFQCVFKPRSRQSELLIRTSAHQLD